MKRMIKNWILALVISAASMPALAQLSTPTSFTPAMTSEEEPLRFFTNLNTSLMFNGRDAGYPTAASKTGLANAQLNLGLIYNVALGFDVGFGIHGGVISPYGLFASPTYILGLDTQYGAMFGADIMIRYLAMLTDIFYTGVQAQVGYDYTDTLPGASDTLVKTLGYKSKGEMNSFIPVVAGMVLGAHFKDAACVYLAPAIELGQTSNHSNSADKASTSPDTGLWKSAAGLQVAVGTAIHLGSTKLVIEAKPRWANFNNNKSWGADITLGAFWDF